MAGGRGRGAQRGVLPGRLAAACAALAGAAGARGGRAGHPAPPGAGQVPARWRNDLPAARPSSNRPASPWPPITPGAWRGWPRASTSAVASGGDALALAGDRPGRCHRSRRLRLRVLQRQRRSSRASGRSSPSTPRRPAAPGLAASPCRWGLRRSGAAAGRSAPPRCLPLRPAVGACWCELAGQVEGMGIKLSPGIDRREMDGLQAPRSSSCPSAGDLKECVLWFGAPRSTGSRATVFPSGGTRSSGRRRRQQPISPVLRGTCTSPIRPSCAPAWCGCWPSRLGAEQIDPQLALLTADRRQPRPSSSPLPCARRLAFSEKSLRAELRRRGVGQVTLKKRGSAVDTEALGRRLRLTGDASGDRAAHPRARASRWRSSSSLLALRVVPRAT